MTHQSSSIDVNSGPPLFCGTADTLPFDLGEDARTHTCIRSHFLATALPVGASRVRKYSSCHEFLCRMDEGHIPIIPGIC